jgi:hypothetical protein
MIITESVGPSFAAQATTIGNHLQMDRQQAQDNEPVKVSDFYQL